ncbi:MAG: tRNA uridine-5-carboxymethylaminomethyl(34) synthesis GTPase MnmE, partial [Flavobacteriales bacterium]
MNAPSSMDDTICAPATPPGSSAIAVVRLSGRDAIGIGSRVFSPDVLRGADSHTLHHGYILRGEEVVDEVLVSVFRAPHTYTGEDLLEISCHGSAFIMEEILNLLVQAGARPAEPGEFTRRAFVNGKLDLSQAEAVADLVESHSEGARRAAVQHLKGGISKIIEKLRSQLAEFSALLELELDFGEEDVEFADRSALKKLIYEIIGVVEKMVASFDAGNAIKNGIPVVISGRPNAGKSTLLNAILNENMALVSEEPGTTRDSIEADIHFDGLLYRFIDTAGMRKAGNNIEHLGIERTKEKIRASSIIIYLFDVNTVSEEMALEDIEEIKHISDEQNPHIIPTGNKTDIAPAGVS